MNVNDWGWLVANERRVRSMCRRKSALLVDELWSDVVLKRYPRLLETFDPENGAPLDAYLYDSLSRYVTKYLMRRARLGTRYEELHDEHEMTHAGIDEVIDVWDNIVSHDRSALEDLSSGVSTRDQDVSASTAARVRRIALNRSRVRLATVAVITHEPELADQVHRIGLTYHQVAQDVNWDKHDLVIICGREIEDVPKLASPSFLEHLRGAWRPMTTYATDRLAVAVPQLSSPWWESPKVQEALTKVSEWSNGKKGCV